MRNTLNRGISIVSLYLLGRSWGWVVLFTHLVQHLGDTLCKEGHSGIEVQNWSRWSLCVKGGFLMRIMCCGGLFLSGRSSVSPEISDLTGDTYFTTVIGTWTLSLPLSMGPVSPSSLRWGQVFSYETQCLINMQMRRSRLG